MLPSLKSPVALFTIPVEHAFHSDALFPGAVLRILLESCLELFDDSLCIEIWDTVQIIFHRFKPAQLVFLPRDVRVACDLLQGVQIVFT